MPAQCIHLVFWGGTDGKVDGLKQINDHITEALYWRALTQTHASQTDWQLPRHARHQVCSGFQTTAVCPWRQHGGPASPRSSKVCEHVDAAVWDKSSTILLSSWHRHSSRTQTFATTQQLLYQSIHVSGETAGDMTRHRLWRFGAKFVIGYITHKSRLRHTVHVNARRAGAMNRTGTLRVCVCVCVWLIASVACRRHCN